MSFSVCSWNVEFFGSRRAGETHAQVANRIDDVFDFLAQPQIQSDVFAIYEVNGGQVENLARTVVTDTTVRDGAVAPYLRASMVFMISSHWAVVARFSGSISLPVPAFTAAS